MRSVSVLESLIVLMLRWPLAQAMAQRDALVEDKALATPAAVMLRDMFEIVQDAALEVIDFREALRQQVARRFLAADAAGAERRDFAIPNRVETARGELLE